MQLRRMIDKRPYGRDEFPLLACQKAAHALEDEHNRPDTTAVEWEAVVTMLPGSVRSDACFPFRVDYGVNLHVRRNFVTNLNCMILDCAKVTISDNVFLGLGVQIYAATHPLDAFEKRSTEFAEPVSIGGEFG